ncbi:MAG: hypothetical protein D8M57_01120 [Candidatus Scalindua sp. AMX11]|nr:MAG: hypothetical protein DWQ00_15100 [Candidatus Scalindua sp.]NOG84992.1 hypothetical protein [Planctomycetota bacterium]RZV93048.1 MAG: hypothetical protein EX341_04050 [Candidatus Scalindua sp. SCAELEC01]TDE66670.1 MAG: hypothetical protein D8M57_01120 [Candidatus Scalindua sp. AMX11]GJQ57974.1 MAG: hypothetical protein SCALA701_07750 [Candidatus Scalindua sp.]
MQNIQLEYDNVRLPVKGLLEKGIEGKHELTSIIQKIILQLNDGYEFGMGLAEEWVHYLTLLVNGYSNNLSNPYSDLVNYKIETLSESSEYLTEVETIKVLGKTPTTPLEETTLNNLPLMSKTICIIAIGGTDTTFYKGLSKSDLEIFNRELYSPELYSLFKNHNSEEFIPRGLSAKKDKEGNYLSNVESMIMHAYCSGIRHVAVIANSKSCKPINEYLKKRLNYLKDLKVIVTVQPLLPMIKACNKAKEFVISAENGGYPGGHGHGFKYCLRNSDIQNVIKDENLEFFIFSNGDNGVVLNWGANHFITAIHEMKSLEEDPKYKNLRIAFFLVWEYLRKGGFSFLLKNRSTGDYITQIFEAELAEKSGADIEQLKKSRGAYNTNVATGNLRNVLSHFDTIPMALKKKEKDGSIHYLFEASLATAITTHQDSEGVSFFDNHAALNILGPKEAKYQHWNHIATRKRDDFFAFFSSIFKIVTKVTKYGTALCIVTQRDATHNYPLLKGNFVDQSILNSKAFFDIFKDAFLDVDDFSGTLTINLLKQNNSSQGRIKFEGDIKLIGTGEISISVPAGKLWIIKDKTIDTQNSVYKVEFPME